MPNIVHLSSLDASVWLFHTFFYALELVFLSQLEELKHQSCILTPLWALYYLSCYLP